MKAMLAQMSFSIAEKIGSDAVHRQVQWLGVRCIKYIHLDQSMSAAQA